MFGGSQHALWILPSYCLALPPNVPSPFIPQALRSSAVYKTIDDQRRTYTEIKESCSMQQQSRLQYD